MAKNNDPGEIRYEVSDLFYHMVVMLEDRGVDVSVIAEELASRRKVEKEGSRAVLPEVLD